MLQVRISAESYHQPAGGAELNRFEVVIPGSRVGVAGPYFVSVTDSLGNVISDADSFINVIAGEIDPGSSRVEAARGSSSSTASTTVRTVVHIIAQDSAGNILEVTDECAEPPSGNPCPLVAIAFSPEATFGDFEPVYTVRASQQEGVSFEVEFFQAMPGFYTLSTRFTMGDGVSLVDYGMVATPTAAPSLFGCSMDDSLGLVECTFDEPTNMPGIQGENPGFQCSLVLADVSVAKLGVGPTCYWRSNRTLSIYTGANPTILVRTANTNADKIVVRDETVRSTAGNSYYTSGFVLLSPPSSVLQVSAALNAPRTLGVCDDLVLDGTSSLGSGGRSLTFEWAVDSDYDATAVLAQMEAESRASAGRASTLQIPTASLLVGGRWTFSLRVTNWLGASDSTTVRVAPRGFGL